MAKVTNMGSNTVITRNGNDGSINLHGSHLWAPVDRAAGYAAPADHGLVGWTIDPATAFGTSSPSAGVMSLARITVGPRTHHKVSSIWVSIAQAGRGVSNAYVGVYSVASDLGSASLVAKTGDASSAFAAAGEVNLPLEAAVTLRGGHRAWILIGLLVGAAATMPSFRGALAQSATNVNLSGLATRYASAGSNLSALPDSIASGQVGGLGCLFWAATG
jgi:hypothetical protein